MSRNQTDNIERLKQWFAEYEEQHALDARCVHLARLVQEVGRVATTNHKRMLDLAQEGLALATELCEPRFQLFYLHAAFIARSGFPQYKGAVEDSIRAVTLAAQDPEYPMISCIWHDLIAAYESADARGYAGEIANALAYLENNAASECRNCVQTCRFNFLLESSQLEEAKAKALAQLALKGGIEPRTYDEEALYRILCRISYRQKSWSELAEWAALLLTKTGESDAPLPELWQAIACRMHEGNEEEALRLGEKALAHWERRRRSGDRDYEEFFEALCWFFESEPPKEPLYTRVLWARRKQFRLIKDRGMITAEFKCQLEICRVLTLLGRRLGGDLERAKEIARQIRKPDAYLDRLKDIAPEICLAICCDRLKFDAA